CLGPCSTPPRPPSTNRKLEPNRGHHPKLGKTAETQEVASPLTTSLPTPIRGCRSQAL
ncbi:unnamed protein product, partial [Rangifer tarandus platyrhynchus]